MSVRATLHTSRCESKVNLLTTFQLPLPANNHSYIARVLSMHVFCFIIQATEFSVIFRLTWPPAPLVY
jgi:hypothetical protein